MTHPQPDIPPSFAIGDVVRLKSGGPAMTVVGPWEGDEVEVAWHHEGGDLSIATLAAAALYLAVAPLPSLPPSVAAPSGDIVVTEAMAEAGQSALITSQRIGADAYLSVLSVYRAMETERRRGSQP